MYTLEHAGISEQGHVRFKNEDSIGETDPEDDKTRLRRGSLFIIADGVGGHGAGDVASQAGVAVVTEHYYAAMGHPDRALVAAVNRANLHIFDEGIRTNKTRMQTTLSALVILGSSAYIAHVGDSRIYRIRSEKSIDQLTRDDSEVAELVRMKIVAPENARHHPRRNIITRAVGSEPVVRPQSKVEQVAVGDTFLMCTDGLWEPVEDLEMADIVANNETAKACQILVDLGLERQSKDNISVQIIKVTHLEEGLADRVIRPAWWRTLLGLTTEK